MNLCLLRPDKAGDALKTLPALRAVKKVLPESAIHLIASHHNASVFEFEPGVKLWTLPKNWESLSQPELAQSLDTLGIPNIFDQVIDLLCDPTNATKRLGQSMGGKYFTIRNESEFSPIHREETENIAIILDKALGTQIQKAALTESRAPIFSSNDLLEGSKLGIKKSNEFWLGLFPLAGTVQRSHPLKKWTHFIRNIQYWVPNSRLFVFGGPDDQVKLHELKRLGISPEKISVHYASSFRTLGAYLKQFDGMIAVDSGPLHLSLALEIPSLGFLSGGDWQRWFSRTGPKDKLLKRGLIQRYPSSFEMSWAFKRWCKAFR